METTVPKKKLLTECQVILLRTAYAKGEATLKMLGLRYGITKKSVGRIVHGFCYKNYGGPVVAEDMRALGQRRWNSKSVNSDVSHVS